MRILAISGSLKASSSNLLVLKTIQKLMPSEIEFIENKSIALLPQFNPDLDDSGEDYAGREHVEFFRQDIFKSDAIIFCSPEYAFGVPGSLKNALDWLVSSGVINTKAVSIITASPMHTGALHANNALQLTLTALGTRYSEETIMMIAMVNKKFDSNGNMIDQECINLLESKIHYLINLANQKLY